MEYLLNGINYKNIVHFSLLQFKSKIKLFFVKSNCSGRHKLK